MALNRSRETPQSWPKTAVVVLVGGRREVPDNSLQIGKAVARLTGIDTRVTNGSPPVWAKLGVAFRQTETVAKNGGRFGETGVLYSHFTRLRPAKCPAHGRYGAVLSNVAFGDGRNGAAGSLAKLCSENLPVWERNGATKPARSY